MFILVFILYFRINLLIGRTTAVTGVGILGAVGREGRNSRLSHYHETSGLEQTRGESVNT